MSVDPLLDPELAAVLPLLPPFTELTLETLPRMRALLAELAQAQIEATPTDGVRIESLIIDGPDGAPLRLAIYRPAEASAPLPAFVHAHGGGLVMGTPEIRHAALVDLARTLRCVFVSVDYRVAPEAKYPAAVEDCYAALAWTHANARALGVDASRIVVGGESAGAGLAAAVAILARDRGTIPVAFQFLVYPMLDDRTSFSDHAHNGRYVWTRETTLLGWTAYLGREPGDDCVLHSAAPARCADLTGLPPAFLAIGALDLFLDEDIEYARRLSRAGVPVEMHIYAGAFHAFDMVPDAHVTKAFRAARQSALMRAMWPQGLSD